MTVDFGLVPLGSIGSTVFHDENNNGQLDPGEETVADKGKTVELTLLDTAGNVIATTTTDANGSYVFDNLLPGDYIVEFIPPASLPVSSGPTDTQDNQQDDDDNGIQQDTNGDGITDGPITSPVITLSPGTEPTNEPGINGTKGGIDESGDNTIDFGLIGCLEISGEAFMDANSNGCLDTNEVPIPDVDLSLIHI